MDPKKKLPSIISKITYLGIGVKPKSKVSIKGDDPTYFVLKTKDEMLNLQEISVNTIVEVSESKDTFIFSVSRKLWMLVDLNC